MDLIQTLSSNQTLDPRIHCEHSQLVKLQAHINGLSLFPHLKTSRLLSGRHLSGDRKSVV